MQPPEGYEVDHINHDGLDNRRCNLRLATRANNCHNQRSFKGSSKYKGVWRVGEKWAACIRVDGRSKRLGTFVSEKEAALAYNQAAREHYGEFAKLNEIGEE